MGQAVSLFNRKVPIGEILPYSDTLPEDIVDSDQEAVIYFHVWCYKRQSPKSKWEPYAILKVPTLCQLWLSLTEDTITLAAAILVTQSNKYETVVKLKPILEKIMSSCPLEEAINTLSKKELELYDKACMSYFTNEICYEEMAEFERIRMLIENAWLTKLNLKK